jgi:hypothetical protein
LGDKAWQHSEEAAIVEIAHIDELVETIRAVRGPGPRDFYRERALRGVEGDIVDFGHNQLWFGLGTAAQ